MEGMSGNWTCFLVCLPEMGLRSDVRFVATAVGLCVGVAVAVTLVSLFVVIRRELRQEVAVVVGCAVYRIAGTFNRKLTLISIKCGLGPSHDGGLRWNLGSKVSYPLYSFKSILNF